MKLYCNECRKLVHPIAEKDSEGEIHRWDCPHCGRGVGCHPGGAPLGSIPTDEMARLRIEIHNTIDPLWQLGYANRGWIYARLSKIVGHEYHTATATLQELKTILPAAEILVKEVLNGTIKDTGKETNGETEAHNGGVPMPF